MQLKLLIYLLGLTFFSESHIFRALHFFVFLLIIIPISRGGSRIFSNGADFEKICVNFVDQIDFPSSSKALKRHCFGQIFCAATKRARHQKRITQIMQERKKRPPHPPAPPNPPLPIRTLSIIRKLLFYIRFYLKIF